MTLDVILTLFVGLGAMMSGVAAAGQFVLNIRLRRLHQAVNGRLTELVAATHVAGVGEGVAMERAHNGNDAEHETPP